MTFDADCARRGDLVLVVSYDVSVDADRALARYVSRGLARHWHEVRVEYPRGLRGVSPVTDEEVSQFVSRLVHR